MSLRAWAELLRLPAICTVPGDTLAGAAAAGLRPGTGTALAAGASLCLYEAGMALNDWADREEDAIDRPHRPLPSGRLRPGAALAAAGALTAAGIALAARAGRPAGAVATGLAATVWAYDLKLKHTAAGPVAMAAARGLDLVLGAVASAPAPGRDAGKGWTGAPGAGAGRPVALAAALLAAHTLALTAVSRNETRGGSPATALTALALTAAVAAAASGPPAGPPTPAAPAPPDARPAAQALAVLYAATTARPLLHAALNPSPQLTQQAVSSGIRAMIPLQAALTARAGAPAHATALLALAPLARALFRKVSAT